MGSNKNVKIIDMVILLFTVIMSMFIGRIGSYLSNVNVYWFYVFFIMLYGVFATTFIVVYVTIAYMYRGEILGDRYTASRECFWGIGTFLVFFVYSVIFYHFAGSNVIYLVSSEFFSIPIAILGFLSVYLSIYLALKPRLTSVTKFVVFLVVSIIHFSIIMFHIVMVGWTLLYLLQYGGILNEGFFENLIYSKSIPLIVISISIPITALDMYKTMNKRYGIDELVERVLTLWSFRAYISSVFLNRLLVEYKVVLKDDCLLYDTLIILNQMNVLSIDSGHRSKEVQGFYRKLEEKCVYVKLAEISLDIFRYRLSLSRDKYKELLKKCRNELMNGRFVNSGELIKMIQEVKSGN